MKFILLAIICITATACDPICFHPCSQWTSSESANLEDISKKQKSTLVQVTADWCVNCRVKEELVLNSPEVKNILSGMNIDLVRADLTKKNPTTQKWLDKIDVGSNLPIYVFFPEDDLNNPIMLPSDLIKQDIRDLQNI